MGVVAYSPVMESGLWAGKPRGAVLRAMANAADDDKWECYPSYEFTAFVAGVGRSTAHREIRALEYCAIVELIEEGGGRRKSNRYRINVTLLELCAQRVRAAKKAAGPNGRNRIAAMTEARDYCHLVFAVLERMMRRIAARDLSVEKKAKAVERAVETAETFLRNRPRYGRFGKKETVPLETETVHELGTKTVHGVDPNLQRNYHLEKRRATQGGENPDPEAFPQPDREGGQGSPDREGGQAGSHREGAPDPGGGAGGPGAGLMEGADAEAARLKARDALVAWLVTGDIDRISALWLKASYAGVSDFRVPYCDLTGAEASAFAARLPYGARSGVVAAADWCARWIAGDDPKEPAPPFKRIEAFLRRSPGSPGYAARIDALRAGVEAARAARGSDGPQAEDQPAEDPGDRLGGPDQKSEEAA